MVLRRAYGFAMATVLIVASLGAVREAAKPTRGIVEFEPSAGEASLPAQFQLEGHSFSFEETPQATSGATMRISQVTFPSPVVTPHPNNNTVHCEYFCPTAAGKKPGVIVLHILGGDFDLLAIVLPHAGLQGRGGAVPEDALLRRATPAGLASSHDLGRPRGDGARA